MDVLQPDGWAPPSGYSNGIKASGDLVFVAGQVGWNKDGEISSDDLVEQVRQALENVVAVLEVGGARPEHIVRMTWYVTDLEEYRAAAKEVGRVYRQMMARHYPAMSLFEVSQLFEESARVEIEATAVIPAR